MKAFYCTESQDRIPIEYFSQGKAVWSGGKPYLTVNAQRLGLKPDITPPREYVDAVRDALQKSLAAAAKSPPAGKPAAAAPEKKAPAANKQPPRPDASAVVAPTVKGQVAVKVPEQPGPAAPPAKVPAESSEACDSFAAGLKTGAGTTVHGETVPVADPLKASTVTGAGSPQPVAIPPAKLAPTEKLAPPAVAKAEPPAKPPEPVKPVAAKPEPVKPATPVAAKAPEIAPAPKPAEPAQAAAPKATPATPAIPKPAVPAAAAKDAAKPAAAGAAPAAPGAAGAKPPPKKEAPRILAEATLGYGEPISAEELTKLPIFEGIPMSMIERLPGAIVKRTFKKGELICLEGQYGSTAFYILSGKADVFINTPISQVKSDKKEHSRGFLGIVRKFRTRLAGRKEKSDSDASPRQFIPNDGPMDLPMDNPIAQMKEGDLFGEMSCMSFYPRSATVRANEDCVMLEMLRNVLQVLQKNKKFKEQLDNAYRTRALGQHLRSVPILKDYVDDKVIDQLRYRVELVEFDPGEIIIKQGDPSDAFYLIRVGSVKVSQTHPGGEIVLTYLGRGDYFGEIGLLKNTPRTATCAALDHVEIVKIKKRDFDFILSTYDELSAKLTANAEVRIKETNHISEHAPTVPLDDFLGQGLMQAQNLLLLDLEKCTRCDECVRACADSHQGVTRLVREGLRFDKFLVPTSCRSCMDPVCMIGCPVGSIRRKDSMEIIIEDWCIGCELCAKQCPYGNISMHPFEVSVADPEKPGMKKAEVKDKAVTCDLCTDLKEPSCVYACPHDAAHRVDARDFFRSGLTQVTDIGKKQ